MLKGALDEVRGNGIIKGGNAGYMRAKCCNILFARELTKRHQRITSFSLQPGNGLSLNCILNFLGCVYTQIWKWPIPGSPRILRDIMYKIFDFWSWMLLTTPQDGSLGIVYCAISTDVKKWSGRYFIDFKPAKTSDIANNDDVARELWDSSEIYVQPFSS